jgi:hypothetical protein
MTALSSFALAPPSASYVCYYLYLTRESLIRVFNLEMALLYIRSSKLVNDAILPPCLISASALFIISLICSLLNIYARKWIPAPP